MPKNDRSEARIAAIQARLEQHKENGTLPAAFSEPLSYTEIASDGSSMVVHDDEAHMDTYALIKVSNPKDSDGKVLRVPGVERLTVGKIDADTAKPLVPSKTSADLLHFYTIQVGLVNRKWPGKATTNKQKLQKRTQELLFFTATTEYDDSFDFKTVQEQIKTLAKQGRKRKSCCDFCFEFCCNRLLFIVHHVSCMVSLCFVAAAIYPEVKVLWRADGQPVSQQPVARPQVQTQQNAAPQFPAAGESSCLALFLRAG